MKLTNYFSVLDQYENWFDREKDGKMYFTFIVESQDLKHKNLAFNPQLHPVSLSIEFAEEQSEFTIEVLNQTTTMFVDPEEGEKLTACPLCFCPGDKMTLTDVDTDGLKTYEHQCHFDEVSIEAVLRDVVEVELLEYSRSLLSGISLDYLEEDAFGFSEDGSHYSIFNNKVYHYHFHEDDIYCSFCSQSEPYYQEGEMVMQLCPVLTKKLDFLKKHLHSRS